jgi:hypothetical protein
MHETLKASVLQLTCSPASFSSLWASMDRLTFAAQICAEWRRRCRDTIMSMFGNNSSAVGSTDDLYLAHAMPCTPTTFQHAYRNYSSRPPCPHHSKAQLRHATWLLCSDRCARGLLPAGSNHPQSAASAPASCVVQHAPTTAAASTSCSVEWPAAKHMQQLCV